MLYKLYTYVSCVIVLFRRVYDKLCTVLMGGEEREREREWDLMERWNATGRFVLIDPWGKEHGVRVTVSPKGNKTRETSERC